MRSVPLLLGRWNLLRDDRRPGEGHDIHGRQAAIKRVALEEPGPGQMYALQAIKHLRRARPDIAIEICGARHTRASRRTKG